MIDAGGRPAAGYFFLPRQEKVTKKKATPGSPTSPSFLSQTGRCATRTIRFAATCSDSARFSSPGLASSLGGSQGEK